jgi:uroporphyrinogen decarboxylase
VAQLADDYGTQESLMISPGMFREFFKPRYTRLIQFIKSKTAAKVFLHCDGAIKRLIPDFIEMGIELLNPLQPTAKDMALEKIKKDFGDQLSFHGAIDNQQVLASGTKQDVQMAVRQAIASLAPGGGYILAAAHIIEPDVPVENIFTMFDTAHTAGKYPIHSQA